MIRAADGRLSLGIEPDRHCQFVGRRLCVVNAPLGDRDLRALGDRGWRDLFVRGGRVAVTAGLRWRRRRSLETRRQRDVLRGLLFGNSIYVAARSGGCNYGPRQSVGFNNRARERGQQGRDWCLSPQKRLDRSRANSFGSGWR